MFENWRERRNKGMNRQQQRYKWYILSQPTYVTSFQYLGLTAPEKNVTKKFHL